MKNPYTRVVFFIFAVVYAMTVFKDIDIDKLTVTAYVAVTTFGMLVLRAETLGDVFKNLSEALKSKWSK